MKPKPDREPETVDTCDAQDDAPRPPLPVRILARTLAVLFGLGLALGLGELVATWVMDGAYPTLNLYEPDLRFGVVLTPSAETRVKSPRGTLTDIRTNALGFRGADWPEPRSASAPVPGRVLVVGDSQVMGWGVDEGATFAARLDADHRFEVLAAGAPTWGPNEYALALAELAPRYRPERVVVLVNAANDWVEAPIPNTRRTTARDGWARTAFGPGGPDGDEAPTEFPLRRFLLGRSHLVLAVRMLLNPPPGELTAALATRFVDDLPKLRQPELPYATRIGRHLAAARATCARLQCELVPVYLPMDIQIDAREWDKYGTAARDVRPTLRLVDALRADAPDLVDLGPALVRASPGAFLPDDYHLSAAGHAVVAAVLAERLAAPVKEAAR